MNSRLNQIPIVYTKGTNYTVGFTIGRQLKSLIQDVVGKSEHLQKTLLPSHETDEGIQVYQNSLELCERKFPNYIKELQGISSGSNVPFHKLFLLNLDMLLPSRDLVRTQQPEDQDVGGCSSILSNGENKMMGHTEDAGIELLNNIFIVSAEIVNESSGLVEEKFTTLTYAGYLPGYTMGFNANGFVHSINTLCPLHTNTQKTPRSFIARSLLRARNLEEVVEIVKDKGTGIADGFSINAYFANEGMMYNIEVCPPANNDHNNNESSVNVLRIPPGETYVHCNIYLRMNVQQLPRAPISSGHRHAAIEKHPKPKTLVDLKSILSDQTHSKFPVFRNGEKPDMAITVASGIFDLGKMEWSIFIDLPHLSEPIVKIPLKFCYEK